MKGACEPDLIRTGVTERSAQNAGTNCSPTTVNGKAEYWGNSYSYDAWGNLLGKSVTKCGAENLSVTADTHNWIHASGTDYQYDAAGNMTFNATAPTQAYTYDQENRITGAAGYTYTYDGDGNRVRKSNGNTASSGTLYWYMTPGVVAESDLAGTLKSEYVFFDGERVARKDFPGNTVAYYFSDHLKTASVITDAAGTIKAESDYYPWGGELQFVNNDSNDYKFTGKKRDAETGLDYFGARYYSNGLGRWISADWSATPVPVPYADFGDPQSLNLFSYVRGLPTTETDLDGHGPCPPCIEETQEVVEFVAEHPAAATAVATAAEKTAEVVVSGATKVTATTIAIPVMVITYLISPGTGGGEKEQQQEQQHAARQAQAQNQGQTQETEHAPEPAPASGGNMKGGGKSGGKNTGTVYRVPGSATPTGNPYIGRHNKSNPAKTRRSNDGRDRTKAKVIRTYPANDTQAGRKAEQEKIDKRGLNNLDNKRNEVRKDK